MADDRRRLPFKGFIVILQIGRPSPAVSKPPSRTPGATVFKGRVADENINLSKRFRAHLVVMDSHDATRSPTMRRSVKLTQRAPRFYQAKTVCPGYRTLAILCADDVMPRSKNAPPGF